MIYLPLSNKHNIYRFGEAISLNGWIYVAKEFKKAECIDTNDDSIGNQSLADCVGKNKYFSPVLDDNYCKYTTGGIDFPKGVVCLPGKIGTVYNGLHLLG